MVMTIREFTDKVSYWLKSHFNGAYAGAHDELHKAQDELNHAWKEALDSLESRLRSIEAQIIALESRLRSIEAQIIALERRMFDPTAKRVLTDEGIDAVYPPDKTTVAHVEISRPARYGIKSGDGVVIPPPVAEEQGPSGEKS
jgi:hypothetical protein